MKKSLALLLFLILALAAAAGKPAHAADDVPLLSVTRLQLAGGANYLWYGAEASEPTPSFGKEWEVGVYGAYNLVPSVDLVGSVAWGLDNKLYQTRIGVRLALFAGER